jgi:threonine dehydratase
METFAEGLATSVPFALTSEMRRDRLDDFRLFSDDDALRDAIEWLVAEEGLLVEGASAAPVAAALAAGPDLAGQTVVIPVFSRNLSASKLRSILGDG